jgi:hypothetical protein
VVVEYSAETYVDLEQAAKVCKTLKTLTEGVRSCEAFERERVTERVEDWRRKYPNARTCWPGAVRAAGARGGHIERRGRVRNGRR